MLYRVLWQNTGDYYVKTSHSKKCSNQRPCVLYGFITRVQWQNIGDYHQKHHDAKSF